MNITVQDFKRITYGHIALYSIMPITNILSVMERGILSHNRASSLSHESIALQDVQRRRDGKVINARKLHDYANLYFDYHNPMLSRVRSQNEDICVLSVNPEVLNLPGVVVTDRNAARMGAQFISPEEMTEILDFGKIYMKYWITDDKYVSDENKAIKCAEVLVPDAIPFEYITGALVVSDSAEQKMKEQGFPHRIVVDETKFFKEGGTR